MRSRDRLREEALGFYVKILFGRAVLVKVVGDGVRFIIRVGDAADVAEARRPARAVAVPARNGLTIEKETTLMEVRGTRVASSEGTVAGRRGRAPGRWA